MKSTALSVLLGLSVLLSTCSGHGYVHHSRSHLCHASGGAINKNCGNVAYEPQSLECLKGFPGAGPADGLIASAQLPQFHELDAAGADRWSLTPISTYVTGEKDGKLVLDFPWTLTAPHVTADFSYFISKKTFDPSKPLTRDQLELTPFCVDDSAKGTRPVHSYVSHGCSLDAAGYSGHHVVLGVWNIGDTVNAFYQVIDVNFNAAKPAETPAEEPAETPAEEPTETPAEEPAETPAEEPTETPTEEPAETPAEEPTEEPTETPAEEPAETPAEEPTEEPAETPAEEPTEEPAETPAEESAEESAEEPAETPAEESAEESAETPAASQK